MVGASLELVRRRTNPSGGGDVGAWCLVLWQDESLTNFTQRDSRWFLRQCTFKALNGFTKWFEAEPERLVVNWDDVTRAGIGRHLHRFFGRTVGPDPRIVAADRHRGDIDATELAKCAECIRQGGVAAKQNSPVISLQEVAIVSTVRIVAHASAPMVDRDSRDFDVAGRSGDRSALPPP